MPGSNVLALDCGGTRCRALLHTADGLCVGEREAGPANWANTPRSQVRENLTALLDGWSADIGVACMAGVLTTQDQSEVVTLLESLVPARWFAFSDILASLWSCDDEDAVCVISGTGSGVCSLDGTHQMVKSGGGGPLIGDVGSGFFVGRTALSRFLVAGVELPCLRDQLEAEYAEGGIQSWLSSVYAASSPQAEVARIGSLVASLAADGDAPCQSILEEALEPLADQTRQHMRTQGFPERALRVYLSGGFWNASALVEPLFSQLLQLPTMRPPITPLQGAMKLAQSLARS